MLYFLGPRLRPISSTSAFLFSLNNVLGLSPFTIDVINGRFAATNDPTKGPVFGLEDLTIGYDNHVLGVPRLSRSVIGGAYSLPKEYNESDVNGFGLLAETTYFTWDDLEVFYYDSELQLPLSPTK